MAFSPSRARPASDDADRAARFTREDPTSRLERQLADHRAGSARLRRELATARARVDELEATLAQLPAGPADADGELAAELERRDEELAKARARITYLEGRLVEEQRHRAGGDLPPHAAPVLVAAEPRPHRSVRWVLPAAVAAVAGLGAGALIVSAVGGGDDASAPVAAPAPAAPRPQAAIPVSCAALGTGGGTCITGKVLTIAGPDGRLSLPGLRAHLLGARLEGRSVRVRVALRSLAGTPSAVRPDIHLSVGGHRVAPRPAVAPPAAQQAATVTLNFRLGRRTLAALRRSGGRADLGVAPLTTSGDGARTTGVLRVVAR